ncbi:extracellular solute-binding protein [Paenibacillus fonticola]|uniref:extracellular solute-binding protein n=1 Tax=Paenibacillus fonticola TaxID=379896 RepID=UPI0003727681|nr:extracellular solute-binding protein [Paenibacillus fonticola]
MLLPFSKKIVIVGIAALSLLAACDQHNRSAQTVLEQAESPSPSAAPYSVFWKYNPPIELTFVREYTENMEDLFKLLPGESLEDNRWSRLYKQALGIEIKYDWVAGSDQYYKKLGAALASGEIPDVVRVDAQQLRQLSNAGLIQDLSEVYELYASPLTKKVLSQEGTGPFERATLDGKLMGIPETNSSIEGATYLWIRTDWLDRLQLQPPQTMDDLLFISEAFTERDPDLNGEKDTFGLAVTNHLWDPVMGVTGFMAGYDAFPNLWLEDHTGKLVYGGIQPEVKNALKALQEMYRKGQIDSEFGFKNGIKVGKQIADGKVGMMYGEQWGSFTVQASRTNDPEAQWQAFPIVSATGTNPKVPLRFSTSQFLAVNKNYKHPEALVQLFNLHLEKNWGETAEYDTYYSNPYPVWKISPVTPYPIKKNQEAFQQIDKARRTGNPTQLKNEAKSIQKKIDIYLSGNANSESGWGWERTYGPEGAFAVLERYEANNQLMYEKFVGAPTATMVEKQTILTNLMHDTYVNIILGSSINEFDRFVEGWNKLGGEKITAEVNEWYAAKQNKQE